MTEADAMQVEERDLEYETALETKDTDPAKAVTLLRNCIFEGNHILSPNRVMVSTKSFRKPLQSNHQRLNFFPIGASEEEGGRPVKTREAAIYDLADCYVALKSVHCMMASNTITPIVNDSFPLDNLRQFASLSLS